MEKIKFIVIVHILFTLGLLQLAYGINLAHDYGHILYGLALIIPLLTSFYNFYTSLMKANNESNK